MSLNILCVPRFGAVYKLSAATCAEYNNRCNANGGWEQLNVMSNGIPAPMDFLAQKTGDDVYRRIGQALAEGVSPDEILMAGLLGIESLPNDGILLVTNQETPDRDNLRALQNDAARQPDCPMFEALNQQFIDTLQASGRTLAIV